MRHFLMDSAIIDGLYKNTLIMYSMKRLNSWRDLLKIKRPIITFFLRFFGGKYTLCKRQYCPKNFILFWYYVFFIQKAMTFKILRQCFYSPWGCIFKIMPIIKLLISDLSSKSSNNNLPGRFKSFTSLKKKLIFLHFYRKRHIISQSVLFIFS